MIRCRLLTPCLPPRFGFRSVWRIAFWNMLITLAGLILIMAAGEVYLRLTMPFVESSWDLEFVPGVGFLYRSHTLVRATDGVEFWTESKVNSLGFLEREPLAPEEAAESCHIAIIGDSFVEAREVQLASRFPVLLEEFAERDLPELNVTTSAFGFRGTGQIQQIAFYDHYAHKMKPDLLVLTFFRNDFTNNSSFLHNLVSPWDPDHPPHYFAKKSETGGISLYPPDPEFADYRDDSILLSPSPPPPIGILLDGFPEYRLLMRMKAVFWNPRSSILVNKRMFEKVKTLRKRPRYASLTADWEGTSITWAGLSHVLMEAEPLMAVQEALDLTAFALDQFQERAERDGVSLVILAHETMSSWLSYARRKTGRRAHIDILREMADARGIPVIELYDHMVRLGGPIEDRLHEMRFRHDGHWNETGHHRVAEALLEYLKKNREICDARAAVELAP